MRADGTITLKRHAQEVVEMLAGMVAPTTIYTDAINLRRLCS